MPNKEELTSRDRINKFCEVKRRNKKCDNIIYGGREFRMNRLLENAPDADLDRIIEDKDLGIGEFILKAEKSGDVKKKKVSTLESKPCECGCGETTRPGSRFKPGHDAKLKSVLRKKAGEGDAGAQKELKARNWPLPSPKPSKPKKSSKSDKSSA